MQDIKRWAQNECFPVKRFMVNSPTLFHVLYFLLHWLGSQRDSGRETMQYPHHTSALVWLGQVSALTALHLTFHHWHPTITDIVLVCFQSLTGPVALPWGAAAGAQELPDQTSRDWLNTHRGTSVIWWLSLSDVSLPLVYKGHASLPLKNTGFPLYLFTPATSQPLPSSCALLLPFPKGLIFRRVLGMPVDDNRLGVSVICRHDSSFIVSRLLYL